MESIFTRNSWKRIASRSPDPLRAVSWVQRIWDVLEPAQRGMLSEAALADILWFAGASPGLLPFLLKHPEETLLEFFVGDGLHLEKTMEPESQSVRALLDKCASCSDLGDLSKEIARFKNTQLVRLYGQEVLGLRPCRDIWGEWSQVAGWCIQGALLGGRAILGKEFSGVRMAVLGMGKLGGEELNFSSDLDLVYLYEKEPEMDPGEAALLADKLARAMTRALEEPTEEGPSFRVDLGLRPGGKDGALALTPDGAELYYQSLGSPWERWALIKARPVAGDLSLGWGFLRSIEPFVFRSSLDYASLEDIRQMKARIQREAKWRGQSSMDVKMGQGGIREVEFLVQTLQIIHGGKRPELRLRDTLGALEALTRVGVLSPEEGGVLAEAYRFLRQLEHRVQMVQLRQTHSLPANEMELRRLASLMGYGDGRGVAGLLDDLKAYQSSVRKAFQALLAEPPGGVAVDGRVEEILGRMGQKQEVLDAIVRAGFREPRAVRTSLERITGPRSPAFRSPRARQILHRILPRMLSRVVQAPLPDQALFRLERFLEVLGPRAGYYALLEEHPRTLERLMEVLAHSALLSRWLSEHLDALDGLVAGHYDEPHRTLGELRDEVGRLLEGLEDQEQRLARLRLFRSQEYLRIGAGDLWGTLHPWEVGEELTRVATVCLEFTLQEVVRAAGVPGGPQLLPMCVVGLGSLGAEELSYRSDLDLMFLYEENTSWRPQDNTGVAEFLTRIAQRLISWMSMPMKEGPGWEVDARLRPSGTRGPLMVSLAAFRDYHERMGRAWERQMLLRARPCGGDPELCQRAMGLIDAVLANAPSPDPKALHEMRLRMERERIPTSGGRGIHLKLGPGGMADIEFLVQYHQWRNWSQSPLVRTPNTVRALGRLEETGVLGRDEAGSLRQAHAFLKGIENRLGLVLDHKATDHPFSFQEIRALGSLDELDWVPSKEEREELVEVLARTMAEVRRIYLKHMAGGA